MTAPALLKTEDLRRAAKVAAETGVEITIEFEGRKFTIRPADSQTDKAPPLDIRGGVDL